MSKSLEMKEFFGVIFENQLPFGHNVQKFEKWRIFKVISGNVKISYLLVTMSKSGKERK